MKEKKAKHANFRAGVQYPLNATCWVVLIFPYDTP